MQLVGERDVGEVQVGVGPEGSVGGEAGRAGDGVAVGIGERGRRVGAVGAEEVREGLAGLAEAEQSFDERE